MSSPGATVRTFWVRVATVAAAWSSESAKRGEGALPMPVLCQSCSRDGAGMLRGGRGGAREG